METTCTVLFSTVTATATSTQTILVSSTESAATLTVSDVSTVRTTTIPPNVVVVTSTSLVPVQTVITNTISSCVGITSTMSSTTSTTEVTTTPTSTTTQVVTPTTTSTTVQATTTSTTAALVPTTTRSSVVPNTSVMNSFGGLSSSQSAQSSVALLPGDIATSTTRSNAGTIAGAVIGGIAGALLLAGLLFFALKRSKEKRAAAEQDDFYRINGHDATRETVFTAGGFPHHSRNTSMLPSRPASPPLQSEGYPQQSLVASVYDPQFGPQAGYGMPQDGYDSASAYGSMNDQAAAAALSGAAGAGIGAYYAQQQYAQALEQQNYAQSQFQQDVQYPPHAHYDPAVYGHDNAQQFGQVVPPPAMDTQPNGQTQRSSVMPNPWTPTTQTSFNNTLGGPMPAVPGAMAQARPIASIPQNMQSEAWRDSYGSIAQETPPRMLGVANPDADADSIRSGRHSPTHAQV